MIDVNTESANAFPLAAFIRKYVNFSFGFVLIGTILWILIIKLLYITEPDKGSKRIKGVLRIDAPLFAFFIGREAQLLLNNVSNHVLCTVIILAIVFSYTILLLYIFDVYSLFIDAFLPQIAFSVFEQAFHRGQEQRLMDMIENDSIVTIEDLNAAAISPKMFKVMRKRKEKVRELYNAFNEAMEDVLKENPEVTKEDLRKEILTLKKKS